MKRVPELDGLRGIAILLVIGCHYAPFARQFWNLPKFGWVGVDLFFVLSGFLITSVLLNLQGQDSAFRKFYGRRIRRIIPPYIAFLVLLYVVATLFGEHVLYSKTAIGRNLFFLQSFENPVNVIRRMTWAPLAHLDFAPAKGRPVGIDLEQLGRAMVAIDRGILLPPLGAGHIVVGTKARGGHWNSHLPGHLSHPMAGVAGGHPTFPSTIGLTLQCLDL